MIYDALTKLHDWLNVEVFWWVRRIDFILFVSGSGCVGWYGYYYGWKGAIMGGVAFVLMMWVGMFFRDTSTRL